MFLRCFGIQTNAGARARAGARAEFWFAGHDAVSAFHAARLLREPIDAPHYAVRRYVLIAKEELEREREEHHRAGRNERGADPLGKRLQPFFLTVDVESRHGVQCESLLQLSD